MPALPSRTLTLPHAFATAARRRSLQTSASPRKQQSLPAFCFDIDGVLLQGGRVLDQGKAALRILSGQNSLKRALPFILLTNGGGMPETERVKKLQKQLDFDIKLEQVVQAHTPFERFLPRLQGKPILVVGGEGENCKAAAYAYGFQQVYNPDDLMRWQPGLWPFAQPPSTPSLSKELPDFSQVKFAEIFVYNDSRNWGRDAQIITDVAASKDGCLMHQKDTRVQEQWTKEKQVPIHWVKSPPLLYASHPQVLMTRAAQSNPDIIWKAAFDLPRLGQGAFQTATQAVFKAVTSHDLHIKTYGKPLREIYDYAEERLLTQAKGLGIDSVSHIYMTGDNPASDIAGANGASDKWRSMLVETGVHDPQQGEPLPAPTIQKPHVLEAITWALEQEGISVS